MRQETTSETETESAVTPEIVSEPNIARSDEAEYALQKFEALKLISNDYANATFEEARQLFEQIKDENANIPASVTFEYALINDLLVPAREKRDLSEKTRRLLTSVQANCSMLSWWMRKIYPFCSDRNKRSFRNLTDLIDVIRPRVFKAPKCQSEVLNPTPNDYKISPTPLIFMAVASSLGLLSSLILLCKAFCCKY